MSCAPRACCSGARADDLDAMHAVFTDPAAMRYWYSLPHTDRAETRAWLDHMIGGAPGQTDDFIVEHEGRAIGKAGCYTPAKIGLIFHPAAWGRGFAAEAMTAAIGHAFQTFDSPALQADVDPRNERCLRLLHRLGFAEIRRAERTFRLGEEWCDSVYLALPRPGA